MWRVSSQRMRSADLQRLDRARRHVGEIAERRADDEEFARASSSSQRSSSAARDGSRAARSRDSSSDSHAVRHRGCAIGFARDARSPVRSPAPSFPKTRIAPRAGGSIGFAGRVGAVDRPAATRSSVCAATSATLTFRIAPAEARIAFGPNGSAQPGRSATPRAVECRGEADDRADVAGILHARRARRRSSRVARRDRAPSAAARRAPITPCDVFVSARASKSRVGTKHRSPRANDAIGFHPAGDRVVDRLRPLDHDLAGVLADRVADALEERILTAGDRLSLQSADPMILK